MTWKSIAVAFTLIAALNLIQIVVLLIVLL